MNPTVKKLMPHVITLLVLTALSFIFFSPYVFDGRVLDQNDINQASGAQTEIDQIRAKTGQAPLWTNSTFSGMPAAQIHLDVKGNLTTPVFKAVTLGQPITAPHTATLVAMLCMYLLLSVLKIDWRLALIGAVTFGISTYNMDIIAAGHSTKMMALAFAPGIIAGTILAFRGQYIIGASLFALFTAFDIYANHYQITYYTFLIIAIIGISELVNAIREKSLGQFGMAALSLTVGLALSVLSNLTTLWTTLEYQAESTRGKTELSAAMKEDMAKKSGAPSSDSKGGLSKDYAFGWSYGIGETMTLLVQNAYGGGASQNFAGTDAESLQISPAALYQGDQPFVGVAIYFGAIIVFLFFLGTILLENRWKWAILGSTLLMIGIAWGKNSPIATTLYEVLPWFNKFRAHTQALGLGQLLFSAMAMLGLQRFFDPLVDKAKKQRALLISLGITGVLAILSMMGSHSGAIDQRIMQQAPQILPQIKEIRSSLAQADAMRSLMLVLAAGAFLWLWLRGMVSKTWLVVAGLGILCLGDAWTASKRVIYEDKFKDPQQYVDAVKPAPIDEVINKDKELHYRVLDLRGGDPFQNAITSRFHKSVGGYYAAKMMIYQEFIEKYLGKFDTATPLLQQRNMPLYGMLNAKYVILDDNLTGLQPNPHALGNAWFVKSVKLVDNADQELNEVGNINPRYEAVIQKKYAEKIGNFTTPQYDSTATITLTAYHPDKMEYQYNAASDQLAVFSEVYYPMEKGWSISVDGQPTTFTKANYLLRAAKLPAGSHKVVMEFHPKSYYSGETYSMIGSGLLLLLFAGGLFLYYRKNNISDVNLLPEEAEKPTPSVDKPLEKTQVMTKNKRKK